ncbi:pectinesterase inhibitor 6 [Carica papaya]|uniref:pectinesterase inhibitor 6 n=1 Tax=Carica papaya TaxID=3649 RepID=UPI000B8CE81E|nr:pectinesterase inhibitor 6 [Carica papaya]
MGAMKLNGIVTFSIALLLMVSLEGSASGNSNSYVRDACSVTQYQALCIKSLASFSRVAKNSPSKWARAGVSVTITESKSVARYLYRLSKSKHIRGRNRVAVFDCIECFGDAIDLLHRSLGILRKLSARNFDAQMSDLTTWLSAALTDTDTCLDGFEGQTKSRYLKLLRIKTLNATYITSNALALVNKLATTGL